MRLSLRYHAQPQRPACAALLRGADSAAWLRELGRWNLSAGQLRCFLVPESIHSVQPAGLLVLVAEGNALPADVLEPYGLEAGRLLVPVQATLWPATTPAELAGALLWPWQLLHPIIGLVGFDTTDELDLATLLDCGPAPASDWDHARPGPPPRPRLQRVQLLAPPAAELVATLGEDIGTSPLEELPGGRANAAGTALLDNLRRRALKVLRGLWQLRPRPLLIDWGFFGKVLGGAALVLGAIALAVFVASLLGSHSAAGLTTVVLLLGRLLFRQLGERKTQPAPRRPAASPAPARPSFGQRIERWLNGRIDNLEQKRQSELERLLRLFAENPAEALKYAIPLGGPYQDRGTAAPSAQLGGRATDFSLGGLGVGGRTDRWDLGAFQVSLRTQYEAAARLEAEAGRHRKAAYIFAKLLGDYNRAAAALEQGGFYREAATLYREHLNNPAAAAATLENGGLLLEAAELHIDMGQHEKAGDLYQRLDDPARAARHYERACEQQLALPNHLAAARLLADKLTDPTRAQEVLLQGWAHPQQPEACLRQYFELLAAAPAAALEAPVREILRHHTPPSRRVALLNVLSAVTDAHPTPELRATALDVAYEVVSTEATTGNPASVGLLRNFLPHDQLLAADCSRFATKQPPARRRAGPTGPVLAPQLDATITWSTATSYRQQWVAVGTRQGRLHLARGNWYGHVEYYSWLAELPGNFRIVLVADEAHGSRILLLPSEPVLLEAKVLPSNKHFAESLMVSCPPGHPTWPTRVALLPGGATATVRLAGTALVLERFAADGQPMPPITHELSPEALPMLAERGWPHELLYRNGTYYSFGANGLLWWSEKEVLGAYPLDFAFQLIASPYSAELRLALATDEGLLCWSPRQLPTGADIPIRPTDYPAEVDCRFVGAEYLVAVGVSGAALYQLSGETAEEVRAIEPDAGFVAVLTTASRQHFALLENTGCVTLHSLHDE